MKIILMIIIIHRQGYKIHLQDKMSVSAVKSLVIGHENVQAKHMYQVQMKKKLKPVEQCKTKIFLSVREMILGQDQQIVRNLIFHVINVVILAIMLETVLVRGVVYEVEYI